MHLKTLLIVSAMALIASGAEEEAEDDCETAAKDCDVTEYKTYVQCIRKRLKRDVECPYQQPQQENACTDRNDCATDSCGDCNCDYCSYNACQSPCTSCCTRYDTCQDTRCCHKTCHSQCKSHSCRISCKRNCYDSIRNESGSSSGSIRGESAHAQNITTVINLHNVINNTNLIEIPVNVTNYNNNNITLDSSQGSEVWHSGQQSQMEKGCCRVVSPRQCVPSDKFPFMRCFHYRKKACGPFCTSPVVHEQPHEVCDENDQGPPNCHQQVIYIPQPQPRCFSQSTWPYINCGLGQQQQPQASCEGCYAHIGTGAGAPNYCDPNCYYGGFQGQDLYRGSSQFGPLQWNGLPGQGQQQNPMGPPPWLLDRNYHVETDVVDKANNGSGAGEVVEERLAMPSGFLGLKSLEGAPRDVSIAMSVRAKESPKYAVIKIDAKKGQGEDVAAKDLGEEERRKDAAREQ